jgi:hypothetical protein
MSIRSIFRDLTQSSYSHQATGSRLQKAPEQCPPPHSSALPRMLFRQIPRPSWASRERVDPAEIRRIDEAGRIRERHDRFMNFYTSMAYGSNSHYHDCAQKFTPEFIENSQDKIEQAERENLIPFELRSLYKDHNAFLSEMNCSEKANIDTDDMHRRFSRFLNRKAADIHTVNVLGHKLTGAIDNINNAQPYINPHNMNVTIDDLKKHFDTAMRLPPSERALKQMATQDALRKLAYCVNLSYSQNLTGRWKDRGVLAGHGARTLREMADTYHQATRTGVVSGISSDTAMQLEAMEKTQKDFASSGWRRRSIDEDKNIGATLDAMLRRR